MKQRFTFQSVIFALSYLALLLFSNSSAFAEGTKELQPNSAVPSAQIQIWDQNNALRKSATFSPDPLYRLNIRICNIGEKIHIGLQQTDTNVFWRLKDPAGNIVLGTSKVPKTGQAGYISTHAQAVAGPLPLAAGGYTPITFTTTAGTGTGDYYIEFNPGSATVINKIKTVFTYIDITVEKSGAAVKGRLWSKAWDLQCNSGSNPFTTKLYIYSKDSVVTSIDFNGMQPFGFVISANSTGCTATGNANNDRKSRVGNVTYPEYPIFLNDPDPACFPSTPSYGALTGPITVTGCDPRNRCINIPVDKAGKVEVLLDLSLPAGFNPGTKDRILSANVVVGNNCLKWDSRDGLGALVPAGTNMPIEVNYFNGLTHLPLFDVEHHLNGYTVQLIRPAGTAPRLYWDDTDITAGTVLDTKTNFSGCSVAGGCHRWKNRGDNGCTVTCPETINTWWYGNIIQATTIYNVSDIVVDANSLNPPSEVNDTTVCSTTGPIQLNGLVSGFTSTGTWSSSTPGGGSFSNANALNSTYTLTAAEKAFGSTKIILTSTGNGACPAVKDTLTIHIVPGPTVSAGPNQTKCKNNTITQLAGSRTIATASKWSGGLGTYSSTNNTSLAPKYTPKASEVTAGSVTLTLTTTAGNGICPAATSQMTISFVNQPTSNAGSAQTKCANNPVATLAGTVTNATSQLWSGGAGTFSDNTILTPTYTPTAAEIAAGSVILTLTASNSADGCSDVSSTVKITYTAAPTVEAGQNQSVCANNPAVTLAGSKTIATGAVWSGGSGSFSGGTSNLTATYTPTAAEITAGSLTLKLTTTGNVNCTAVKDSMKITFTPSPTRDAGFDATVCANNPSVVLAATSSTGKGTWTGGCGTFVPNANTPNATYTPCASETSGGAAALIWTTTDNGNCNAEDDTMIIVITASPTVSAGSNKSVCANKPDVVLAGTATGFGTVLWTGGAGTFTGGTNNLTATYTPTPAEIAAKTVTLTLTANRNTCLSVSSQMTITITDPPTASAGADRIVCANNPAVTLNGSVTVATGGTWTGGSGVFSNANALNSTYTPSVAERVAGNVVTLTLTTTGMGNCNAVSEQMTITMTAAPTANAGATDHVVCKNNSTVTLAGSTTIATGGTWSGGTGTFSPDANTLNATYTPGAAETSATLTLTTTTGNGNCNAATDQVLVTVTPSPTANAGTNQIVCADNPTVTLNGTVTVATGGIWSGGAGTFSPDNTTLNATYTPTVAEVLAGTVTLTLTTTGSVTCNPVTSNMTITITKAPTVDAGQNQTLCGTINTVQLDGSVTIATGGTWTTAGTGTFSPNTPSGAYKPSAADKTAGFVDLTLTTTGMGSCNAVSGNIRLTFSPAPFIFAGPDQTVCTNEYPIQLSATGSPGSWGGSSGTISDPDDLNATYTPSAAQELAGFVVLTITSHPVFGCGPVSSQIRINILPKPVPFAGADQTVCGTVNSVPLSGTISGSATGGFWTTTGQGSFSPDAATLNASYIPTAAEKASGAVITNTLTSTPNSPCPAEQDNMILTITPAITVEAGPPQTFCADVNSYNLNGIVTVATGGTWSITTGSGTLGNATSLNTTYTPSAADKTTGTVTLKLTSSGNGTCPAVTDNITFTITPAPTADAGTPQTICADVASINLTGIVGLPATGGTWTSNGTGTFSPNATTLATEYFPSAADTAAGSVTFTLTTSGNGTCNAVTDQVVLTINKKPVVIAGPDQSVCADDNTVNLNGFVANATGGAWTTAGSGSFSNAAILNPVYTLTPAEITGGTVTLTLTSTGMGTCNAVKSLMIITITPAPTITAVPDKTICADATGVTLNGTITVATGGKWTGGTGTFTPNANTVNATYIPTAADTAAGSVTLTLETTGNGTCNVVTEQMIITITKKPIVQEGSDQTICADSSYVTLNGQVFNAGGGIWSTGGTGNFFPNNTTLNANYVPSPADKASGTITLTLTSDANGSCNAVQEQVLITVTPGPTANAGDDQTICADIASIALSGSKTIATGAKWTTTGNGTFSNATILNPTYTPSANDKSSGNVTLTLTTTGNGTCKFASNSMLLTINPIPTANPGSNQTICADASSVLLDGKITGATGGRWTSSGTGGFSDTSALNATYFPSDADKLAGTVTLTLTTTGNGTCNPVSQSMTLIITPIPTVTVGPDQTICADAVGAVLSGSVSAEASGGIWSSAGTGSFSPSATTLNATYIPSAAEKTGGTATLTLTTTGMGTCNAVSKQVIISITPVPTVDAGPNQDACADFEAIQLDGTVTVATAAIWTTDGSGTFTPDANSSDALYSPSAADVSNGTITLTLTTTAMATCNAVSKNMTITFSPIPTVDAGPNVTACTGTTGVSLNPTITGATGGIWTTTGTGTFTPDETTKNATYIPSVADQAGSVKLFLETTGNGSCNFKKDSLTISFSPLPPINAGSAQTVCETDLPVQLDGTGSQGQWSGGAGTFLPNNQTLNATYMPTAGEITTGTVNLTLTTTGIVAGCTGNSSNVTITISAGGPTVSAGVDLDACANTTGIALGGSSNTTVKWTTGSGTGTFLPNNTDPNAIFKPSPTQITAGVAHLTLTTTGNGACNAKSEQKEIFIGPVPTVSAGQDQNVCATATSIQLTSTETIATGVLWSLIPPASGTFASGNNLILNPVYNPSPADTTTGLIKLEVTTTGNGTNCAAVSDTIIISFTGTPIAIAGASSSHCADVSSVALNGSVTSATTGTWSTGGTGTFSPNTSTLNASYIPSDADKTANVTLTLTTTDNGACVAGTSTRTLTFTSPPTVSAGGSQIFCSDVPTATLTGSSTFAGGILWTTTGTGTFDDDTDPAAVYTPSAQDKANGGVNLTITTTGSAPCAEIQDFTTLSILPAPTSTVNAGFDQIVCKDVTSIDLEGLITVAGGGKWSTALGTGTFSPSDSTLDAQYIPSAADKLAGSVVLTLASTANGICTPASDNMTVTFTSSPTIVATAPSPVCGNVVSVSLTGVPTVSTGGEWSTAGTGFFAPNEFTLNATYFPSAADVANGSVGLTLVSTGNGTCDSRSDTAVIKFTKIPLADAGLDKILCSDVTTTNISGTLTNATAGQWTTSGTGTFGNLNALSTTYIPSAADIASTRVNLTLTTTAGTGTCAPANNQMTIDFTPAPTVNAGPAQTICADLPGLALNGGITVATGGLWTTAGSGTFTSSSNQLNATYSPSQADKTAGTVTLTLTTTGNGTCNAVTAQKIITIDPIPTVNPGPAVSCAFLDGAILNGVIGGTATGGQWSSTGTGVFSPDAFTLNATYFPSLADLAAGSVTLTLTSTGNATCNPVSRSVTLLVKPLPIAFAGPDQFVCRNSSITLVAQPSANVSYTWTDNTLASLGNLESVSVSVPNDKYIVLTVTDPQTCLSRDTVRLNVYDLPTLTLPATSCLSDSLTLDANPTSMPVVPGEFQWYRAGAPLAGENDFTLVVKQTGIHTVTWSYASCSVSASSSVTAPPTLATVDTIYACEGGTASLTTVATPSTGVTYTWTPGAGSGIPFSLTPVLTGLTTYYVTATDALSCSAIDSIKVIGIPVPHSVIADDTVCQFEAVILDGTDTSNTTLTHSYQWKRDGVIQSNTTSTLTANTSVAATNTFVVISTIGQCIGSDTAEIVINPVPADVLPADTRFCIETQGSIVLDAGAGAGYTYLWSSGNTNQKDTISLAGMVHVTVNNPPINCPLNDSILVRDVCEPKLFVPTAFSPNGKGTNETFDLFGNYLGKCKITIFNRWGEIIYYSENIPQEDGSMKAPDGSSVKGWDGTYRGEPMPIGVYPWLIVFEGQEAEFAGVHKIEGSVTIVR